VDQQQAQQHAQQQQGSPGTHADRDGSAEGQRERRSSDWGHPELPHVPDDDPSAPSASGVVVESEGGTIRYVKVRPAKGCCHVPAQQPPAGVVGAAGFAAAAGRLAPATVTPCECILPLPCQGFRPLPASSLRLPPPHPAHGCPCYCPCLSPFLPSAPFPPFPLPQGTCPDYHWHVSQHASCPTSTFPAPKSPIPLSTPLVCSRSHALTVTTCWLTWQMCQGPFTSLPHFCLARLPSHLPPCAPSLLPPASGHLPRPPRPAG